MKRRLKIGIVVDQLIAGGVQLSAIQQVRHLRSSGHDARLLILMRKKYPHDYSYLVNDIPFHYLSDSYPRPFRRTVKFPVFSFLSTLHLLGPFFAPQTVKKKEFDLLIGHGTTTCLTTQALWQKRDIPYFAVIHDPMVYILEKCYSQTFLRLFFFFLKPLAMHFERSFVKDARQTLIDSGVHSSFILRKYGVKPVVLALGCQPLGRLPSHRGKDLLTFGRWQKEKNVRFFLRLLRALPRVNLIIAGTWIRKEDLQNFREEIRKNRLQKRIRIITQYNQSQLENLCRQSRAWIHPHFEAFGLGALEAASFGLPVIIPAGSGVTELFREGVDGFFPKKITVSEYKKCLLPLLKNERLASKMGAHAWQQIKSRYSWEAHAEKLTTLIKDNLQTLLLPKITAIEIGHAGGTGLSGGDRLFEEMAKKMSGKFRIEVITSPFGSQHWLAAKLPIQINILKKNIFENNSGPVSVFLSYFIRILQTTAILLKTKPEPQIIYSSTNIFPDVFPALIARLAKPKSAWIARIHHLIPPPHKREGRITVNIVSFLMQLLALSSMKAKADLTIALNEDLYRRLAKIGFPEKRLAILGAGIDFTQISRHRPHKPGRTEAVFLGRFHVAKGVFDLVQIWQGVVTKLPKARLVIIGAGPREIEMDLREQITKANLSKNIKLTGYIPQSRVFDCLKSAKVFLFTDHEAGWGLAIAEAMACKLPVVGYDIGVLGDVFKKGFRTVAPFDKNLFSQEVYTLLCRKTLRQQTSRDAWQQARQLSWEKTTEKFLKIIRPYA